MPKIRLTMLLSEKVAVDAIRRRQAALVEELKALSGKYEAIMVEARGRHSIPVGASLGLDLATGVWEYEEAALPAAPSAPEAPVTTPAKGRKKKG